jgi:signal transduction histidine kinase
VTLLADETDPRPAVGSQDEARLTDLRGTSADDVAVVLAHELRGPLTVVNGYLDLLGRAQDEATREYALGAAQRAVARMDALIDDVLKSVHATREAPEPLPPIDAASVARSLLAGVPAYQARVSFANSSTMLARADVLRLERVLSNVLDNALKFSAPDAKVRLTLVDSGSRVRFIIEDEGPGIPPEDAERLTHRFERLDRDSALPGYGIGLGVTVELMQGMGGEVVLGNRSDRTGARVELTLPAVPVASDS